MAKIETFLFIRVDNMSLYIKKKRKVNGYYGYGALYPHEYGAWKAMLHRCNNPKNPAYKYYGGQGIKVSREWSESFETFLKDMGQRPKGMSLDRTDPYGGYCKENCRWVSDDIQRRNRKKSIWIEDNGKSQTLSEWSTDVGISKSTLYLRFISGWSVEKMLTTSVHRK